MSRWFIAGVAGILMAAVDLGAQTVLAGTGNPDVDVPAVQAAVDQGGRVVLTGHFSFDRAPTKPAGALYNRMVTVSQDVAITGSPDQNGDLPTITGGNWPFFVDAVSAHVTIEGLHFVGPSAGAIWVYAIDGLTIANCRIEGIQPTVEFGTQAGQATALSSGISVLSDPHPPNNATPGRPGNFSGTLAILNNDIDMALPPAQPPWALRYSASADPRIMRWTSTFQGTMSATSRSRPSIFVWSADGRISSRTR
jgi:hypothetical protein